jgi:hypothetical protein
MIRRSRLRSVYTTTISVPSRTGPQPLKGISGGPECHRSLRGPCAPCRLGGDQNSSGPPGSGASCGARVRVRPHHTLYIPGRRVNGKTMNSLTKCGPSCGKWAGAGFGGRKAGFRDGYAAAPAVTRSTSSGVVMPASTRRTPSSRSRAHAGGGGEAAQLGSRGAHAAACANARR